MPRKGDRKIAPRVMHIFEETGKTMQWIEIFKAMAQHDWRTNQASLSANLKYLISEGKIVKVGHFYGIPLKRKNGSKYIKIRNVLDEDETVELGK